MKFCATIGSYQLEQFVELNILALRKVFGNEIEILVSDDLSQRSSEILDVAAKYDVHHWCSTTHRGHFYGDLCQICNCLAFAEAQGAEIALKISQRFILYEPAAKEVLENAFADPEVWLALPGRIHPGSIKRAESRFFANLSVLTDFFAVRTGKLSAETVQTLYETRVKEAKNRFDTLIEPLFGYIQDVTLAGHVIKLDEFSSHYPGRPHIYLRKCQEEPAAYQVLARELGMPEPFNVLLQEWRALDGGFYRPVPVLP